MSATGAPRLRALIERSAPAPAARTAEAQEHCDLCGVPVPEHHRHVLDLRSRELLCACLACKLLFDHDAAGGQHFRLIPERYDEVEDLRLDELGWRALGLPVDMAFFVREGASGRMTAFYPSPAGATESALDLDTWADVEAANPSLRDLRPDVEALLVRRVGERRQGFRVGVDECYRLVAVVRSHWRGFSGGDDVWREIDRFFDGLHARARARA